MWGVLIVYYILLSSGRFHGIYILNEFPIVNTRLASAFVDHRNHVHILVSTLASIRSYNLNGDIEWIKPGMKYFGDYDRTYKFKTDFITMTQLQPPDTVIVFSVNLRNGKVKDRILFTGRGLFPIAQGLRGNFFILRSRENTPSDNPIMRIFKLDEKGEITPLSSVKGGFIKKISNFWKDDLIILDMWAPMNFENPSRAGIMDTHVGAAMISTSTGLVINRFMIPFEGFAYSYIIHSPGNENSFILSYRGNYRNEEQFSGFYEISLPTMKKIHHLEIKGNIYPTPVLLNGRFIAGVDVQNKRILIIDAKTLKIMRILSIGKYLIPINPRWGHLTVKRGITTSGSMDVNHDGIDDLIVIYNQRYDSTDPVWAETHDNRGKVVGNVYLFVIMGPDYNKIFPLILPVKSEIPAIKLIPWRNLLISISYSDATVTIYKLF